MKHLRSRRGDTLIEVTMALAILSLVLVGAYVVATGSFRQNDSAAERNQAAAYLQEQAEALHNYRDSNDWPTFTFSHLPLAVDNPAQEFHMECTTVAGCHEVNNSIVRDGLYTVGIVGHRESQFGGTYNVAVITVTVTWPSHGGGSPNKTDLLLHLADLDGLKITGP